MTNVELMINGRTGHCFYTVDYWNGIAVFDTEEEAQAFVEQLEREEDVA